MRLSKLNLALVTLATLAVANANAAVDYTSGTYSQDFDTLPTQTFKAVTLTGRGPHALSTAYSVSGVDGWEGANPSGSSSNTEFKAHNGSLASSAGRGVISYGADDSSDRALGVLATSNQINSFGLVLRNASPDTLNFVNISAIGEQWRRGNVSTPDSLTFAYLVSDDAGANIQSNGFTNFSDLNFVSPNTQSSPTEVAIDGNAPENQASLSGDLTNLNWKSGSYLVVRWTGVDISGQDDGLGIDTFRFSAAVPEPTTGFALLSLGLVFFRRARR